MPTANRRPFVPWAIADFLRQDYPSRELIVVDDGDDSVADLIPDDSRIVYVRLDRREPIGTKRNIACERASGDVIAHWDDDDWHAPNRLSVQVEALMSGSAAIAGLRAPLYFEPSTGRAWRFAYRGSRPWLSGNSLCYRRDVWQTLRFAPIDVGEDSRFVAMAARSGITAIGDDRIHVSIIHAANVSPKRTASPSWRPIGTAELLAILGPDASRFDVPDFGRSTTTRAAAPLPAHRPPTERSLPMLAVAKRDDLELPEFRAYGALPGLPWMRRWEQPFVLFNAALADTMSVLDCTVNPAGFESRLRALYPEIAYRHVSPIQGGAYAPLIGVPDGAYDRVVATNTLEHLPRAERGQLVAEMAAKLKPGGLLLLTSDAYFDESWGDPAFLRAGVMRPDRSEFVGGYNKTSFDDWLAICKAAGLEPAGDGRDPEPSRSDGSLYLNQPPHVHAALGGVFRKPDVPGRLERPAYGASRRIVLSLLSWNTRDVTVESVDAYVREARMLRRLGHEPLICICDNGSDDGSSRALRARLQGLDVGHRLILNRSNRGNSIARNQIIDVAVEAQADYVLFMDGDIEIVPFSSVAMLRYMEHQGGRLGCIGPHSWGITNQRAKASSHLFSIDPSRVKTSSVVAWTQYGLFRGAVFRGGIRFDDHAPFNGAGWGFEDNDLAFQMDVAGYVSQYFTGLTYLHRDARSSIRVMRARGIDARALYEARKRYVVDKWAPIARIAGGPLLDVRRATMP